MGHSAEDTSQAERLTELLRVLQKARCRAVQELVAPERQRRRTHRIGLPQPSGSRSLHKTSPWKAAEWNKITRGLDLGGDTLTRPPRGYRADHPMINHIKRKDFIASLGFSEAQVCSAKFLNDASAACRKLAPMVGFLARAQGLQF